MANPVYVALCSFLVGVAFGVVLGWKAHTRVISKRSALLKEKRDFYKQKALETQQLLEQQ